ncbi:MAG: peroxiredoxin family protein [Cellvibrionaceae bacterium]
MLVDQKAPDLITSRWLNDGESTGVGNEFSQWLSDQLGKVVVIHAFQMLCPGCVSHSIPQAKKMYDLFPQEKVAIIGLHSVFEHHDVMNELALKAFIHEYRIPFPVAIDQPQADSDIPLTMSLYRMQGTPTLIVIDKQGIIRLNHFGRLDDMVVGSFVSQLIYETSAQDNIDSQQQELTKRGKNKNTLACDEKGCSL